MEDNTSKDPRKKRVYIWIVVFAILVALGIIGYKRLDFIYPLSNPCAVYTQQQEPCPI